MTSQRQESVTTDLAPHIHRQRLVIEGLVSEPITAAAISDYLRKIGALADMHVLAAPVTHRSPAFGWAGWIHWETSGAHFYAWDRPDLFFSVDIYTCKPFDPSVIINFTEAYFVASDLVSYGF